MNYKVGDRVKSFYKLCVNQPDDVFHIGTVIEEPMMGFPPLDKWTFMIVQFDGFPTTTNIRIEEVEKYECI